MLLLSLPPTYPHVRFISKSATMKQWFEILSLWSLLPVYIFLGTLLGATLITASNDLMIKIGKCLFRAVLLHLIIQI